MSSHFEDQFDVDSFAVHLQMQFTASLSGQNNNNTKIYNAHIVEH